MWPRPLYVIGAGGRRPLTVLASESEEPGLVAGSEAAASSLAGMRPRPLYVIARTSNVDQAEADLQRALFVTVGGSCPPVAAQQVLEVVARCFNVEPSRMAIMATAPEDFLLVLPDRATADRVLNGSSPLHEPSFPLFFKRWTRLANAAATALPGAVDVELRCVPAHAWEESMAQQLLGGSCWVRALHPDTAARRDLSAFRVLAWCRCPDWIPSVVDLDLVIPNPTPAKNELSPVKRGLLYPVEVALMAGAEVVVESPPSASNSPEHGRRHRCRRGRSPSSRPSSSEHAPTAPQGGRLCILGWAPSSVTRRLLPLKRPRVSRTPTASVPRQFPQRWRHHVVREMGAVRSL
jgi:hypothetical protein